MGGKARKSSGKMTATGAYSAVAEKVGLKSRQVKEVAEAVVALAATQLKKSGQFKFAGALNMKLKKKPAQAALQGDGQLSAPSVVRHIGFLQRRRWQALVG